MRLYICILFLIPIFCLCQKNDQKKNYISIGLFDHKSGFSALSYSKTILQNYNNEIFIGLGSMIALNTFSIGYKRYLIHNFVDGYSALSFQKIYGMAGGSDAAFLSIGAEKKIWKILFINGGINITLLVESLEFLSFPNININFRF